MPPCSPGPTIKAPIALPLAGRRQRGYIHQRDVAELAFADEFMSCLRLTPRFVFQGETRRPAVAREVLLAGATGHPILSTLHCGGIIDGLMRLAELATEPGVIGGRKAAFELLACACSSIIREGRMYPLWMAAFLAALLALPSTWRSMGGIRSYRSGAYLATWYGGSAYPATAVSLALSKRTGYELGVGVATGGWVVAPRGTVMPVPSVVPEGAAVKVTKLY